MSSQTSLLLPWQPGSEKRVIWRRHRENPLALSPDPCLLLPPTAFPPYLSRPVVQLALDLQCWALAGRKVIKRLTVWPPYCLPTICHSKVPTCSLWAPLPNSWSTEDVTNLQGPHHPIPGGGCLSLPFPSFQEIRATKPFGLHSARLLLCD